VTNRCDAKLRTDSGNNVAVYESKRQLSAFVSESRLSSPSAWRRLRRKQRATHVYLDCWNSATRASSAFLVLATFSLDVCHPTGPCLPELSNPFWDPGAPWRSICMGGQVRDTLARDIIQRPTTLISPPSALVVHRPFDREKAGVRRTHQHSKISSASP
jgi:hypothetical protein